VCNVADGNVCTPTSAAVPLNTWARVTLQEKAGMLFLYVDKTEVGSIPIPHATYLEFIVRLGTMNAVKLYGSVDELRVFESTPDLESVWCHEEVVVPDTPPDCGDTCTPLQTCVGPLGGAGTCFCNAGYALING
jgi:hypothetical protein